MLFAMRRMLAALKFAAVQSRAEPVQRHRRLLIAYAMIVYPVIGTVLGHGYPSSPSFGVAPCPTTIFTFGLLLCTNARVPKSLLVIPLIWSLIGFYAAVSLGIREDIGLLLAGLVCAGLIFWRDRPTVHTSKREHYA